MFRHLSMRVSLAVLTLSTVMVLGGCNSVRVVRNNVDRSAQARRERREHADRPTETARKSGSPIFPNLEQPDDEIEQTADEIEQVSNEGEETGNDIQQAAGQMPSSPAVIGGRVVDLNGRPQPSVSVVASATGRTGGDRVETTTDSGGNFMLRGLAEGRRYLVLATAINAPAPLIGRAAATPPDQNVVIEIARPFTVSRQVAPRVDPSLTARSPSSSPSQPQISPKRTMQELVAENRLESPWDMPAPPQQRTPPATARDKNDSAQKSLDSRRLAYRGTKLGSSLLEPLPTDTGPSDAVPDERTQQPDEQQEQPVETIDPRKPLSQPTEIQTRTNLDAPRTNQTSAKLELEPAEPKKPSAPEKPPRRPYDGPTCEFDGNRLVDFQLPDLQQQPVAFSELGGRLILVDFWGSWCIPCLKSIPHLADLERRYGPQGLQVVGIAYEHGEMKERVTRVQEVRDQLGIRYPLLLGDFEGFCPVREKFGIRGYPTLVLMDKSGRVLWRREGPESKDLQQLEKLLKIQLAAKQSGYN